MVKTKEQNTDKVKLLLPSIKNKLKRTKLMLNLKYKIRQEKQKNKKKYRDPDAPKQIPHTIESMRTLVEVLDAPSVNQENEQILDEFTITYSGKTSPKVIITTCREASEKLLDFSKEFQQIIPNSELVPRRNYTVEEMTHYGINREYTALLIFNERNKKPEGLWIMHLPEGPTAHFKLSNTWYRKQLPNHGNPTEYLPELLLKNFDTRLGARISRLFGALFPVNPQYRGRNAVTFHNQRDFIFFRHHRYLFNEKGDRVRLQEVGPRMTLKLRSLQKGLFQGDPESYEFRYRPRMQIDRKVFYI